MPLGRNARMNAVLKNMPSAARYWTRLALFCDRTQMLTPSDISPVGPATWPPNVWVVVAGYHLSNASFRGFREAPAGPGGPVAPSAPAGPCGPAGPAGPCDPATPCGPGAPVGP